MNQVEKLFQTELFEQIKTVTEENFEALEVEFFRNYVNSDDEGMKLFYMKILKVTVDCKKSYISSLADLMGVST